jgi:hypothetical protein
LHYAQWKNRQYCATHGLIMEILEIEKVTKEARKCSAAQGPQLQLCRALSEDVSKSCDECKGSFVRGCEAKRRSH